MKLVFSFVSLVLCSTLLCGSELVIRTPNGSLEVLEIAPEEHFEDVVETLNARFGSPEYLLDFRGVSMASTASDYVVRDYNTPVTGADKREIAYIVNTLGMASLAKIGKLKSSLKKAGKAVEHVHPFRFLQTVFIDDHMRASAHAIRSRSFVWGDFFGGIKRSFEEEAAKGNVTADQAVEFAAILGVDSNSILSIVQAHDWSGLVNFLIDVLPRNPEAGRYDM